MRHLLIRGALLLPDGRGPNDRRREAGRILQSIVRAGNAEVAEHVAVHRELIVADGGTDIDGHHPGGITAAPITDGV